MNEIYTNVRQNIKEAAEAAWDIAMHKHNLLDAAEFLSTVTDYYSGICTPEETEFIRFYFRMKMEEEKNK